MPFASMSNVTSTCGMPRGAGGMSVRSNRPSDLLSLARSRSPCSTWIVTAVWLSSAVENACVRLGRDRGVLLDQLRHHAAERLDAERQRRDVEQQHVLDLAGRARRACIAAPTATASSGFTSLRGSLPKKSFTIFCTCGMRGLAADEDDLVDLVDRQARVLQRDADTARSSSRRVPRPATRASRA